MVSVGYTYLVLDNGIFDCIVGSGYIQGKFTVKPQTQVHRTRHPVRDEGKFEELSINWKNLGTHY